MATVYISFFALLVIPIVVMGLLGLILAIIRSTRVAGMTMLVVLALVLIGGAGLLVLVPAKAFHAARIDYGERMDAIESSSSDAVIYKDELTTPAETDTVSTIPIELGDTSSSLVDGTTLAPDAPAAISTDVDQTAAPSDSSVAQAVGEAEFDEFVDESEWIISVPATGGPAPATPVGVTLPERPKWAGAPTYVEDLVDYVPVTSGPWVTRGECRRALHDAMQEAVNEYIMDHHGEESAVGHVGIDLEYIKAQLQDGQVYEEMVKFESIEHPMRRQHALLKFGKGFRDEIEHRWNQVVVTSRLAHVALVLVAVLMGLGTIFTYFRLDTATKGYYSGRLQFATGTVILGLVALGILVARWVPWL